MRRMTNNNYSASVIHGEYYPHIDGIRALAVLPVVLFHILACLCPGGFAGVDVFFVISGYLITGGILRDLAAERFTIRGFYHRRIRRILPAYFTLIACVFAVGCALYYATPLILLGNDIVAGTLFVSNLHFWSLSGDYFSPDLHTQALLHLWSLSVEEQFYLFIPLLCAIVWKFRRGLVAPVLGGVALLSLAGAVHAVAAGKASNAFYLLHFRAWELLAGALLAMLPPIAVAQGGGGTSAAVGSRRLGRQLPAAGGLLLILGAYVLLSSRTPFPGAAALPSVLGTALLIRYGNEGWVSRVLAWRPFVLTGKISYSLYLWHWPVIVFWRYGTFEQVRFHDGAGMFLLALLLAYLSWRFVEIPVRSSAFWTMRRTFAGAATGILVLVAVGTVCVSFRGWPAVLHSRANRMAYEPFARDSFVTARIFSLLRRAGDLAGHPMPFVLAHDRRIANDLGTKGNYPIGAPGQPELFILGDSHVGALSHGLDTVLRERQLSAYLYCRPGTPLYDEQLREAREALQELERMPAVRGVLLVQRWELYAGIPGGERTYAALENYARKLRRLGKRVLVAADNPCYPQGPAGRSNQIPFGMDDLVAQTAILRPAQAGRLTNYLWQTTAEYDRQQGEINRRLENICRVAGATFVPLHLAFLEKDRFVRYESEGADRVSLYRNPDHLARAGSLRAARYILPWLVEGLRERELAAGEGLRAADGKQSGQSPPAP